MFCMHCGKQIVDDAAFCPYCGTKQEVVKEITYCPNCGKEYEEEFRFCHACGTPLAKKTVSANASNTPPEANVTTDDPGLKNIPIDDSITPTEESSTESVFDSLNLGEMFGDLFANPKGYFVSEGTKDGDVWGTLKVPFQNTGVLVDIYDSSNNFIETNYLQDVGFNKKTQKDQILLSTLCTDYPAGFWVIENKALTDELEGYFLDAFRHAIPKADYQSFSSDPSSAAWIGLMAVYSQPFAEFFKSSKVNPLALSFMIYVCSDLARSEEGENSEKDSGSTPIKEYKGVTFGMGKLLSSGMGKLYVYSDKLVFDYQYKNNNLLSLPLGFLTAKKHGFELPYYLVTAVESQKLSLTSGANTTLTLTNGSFARFVFFSSAAADEVRDAVIDGLKKLPPNAAAGAGKMTADEWVNQFGNSIFDAPKKK